jgi:hypothetical protein
MENRLYPMRELLADLLLENGDPAHALDEYGSVDKERAGTPARLLRSREGS